MALAIYFLTDYMHTKEQIDKAQHDALAGHMQVNDTVVINGEYVRINQSFNIYKENILFNASIEKNTTDDSVPLIYEFGQWLDCKDYISKITEKLTISDLVSTNIYSLYPFYPSYKDVVWCVRVLKHTKDFFKSSDIYLLALYREIEIKTQEVEKIIISRNTSEIIELICDLNTLHQEQISLFFTSQVN